MSMDIKERDNVFMQAKSWVMQAGEKIRNNINEPLEINTKSNQNDLVTSMDAGTESFFVENIKATYPDHLILSEEGYGDEITSLKGTVWIIDPIDGTMNFVHQKRNFAISIGIYYEGVGQIGLIYDVMSDVLYSAKKDEGAFKDEVKLPSLKETLKFEESILGMNHFWLCENRLVDNKIMQQLVSKVRGTRSYGSAALEFAYTAEGITDGYLAMNLSPWDIAAGIVIANEVGGITTDMDGQTLTLLDKSSVLTCHPKIHETIVNNYFKKGRK